MWGPPAELLDLTAADCHNTANRATAITDAAIEDLYVAEDQNGMAEINLAATFAPGVAVRTFPGTGPNTDRKGTFAHPGVPTDLVLGDATGQRTILRQGLYDAGGEE